MSDFDHDEVPATFAFVAERCDTVEQVRVHAAWFEPVIHQGRDWLEPFRTDLSAGAIDGWLCPGALRAVTASGAHEIASHGICHAPLGESDVTSNVFMAEFARVRAAEALLGIASVTGPSRTCSGGIEASNSEYRSCAPSIPIWKTRRNSEFPRWRHSVIGYLSPINHERSQLPPLAQFPDRPRNRDNAKADLTVP